MSARLHALLLVALGPLLAGCVVDRVFDKVVDGLDETGYEIEKTKKHITGEKFIPAGLHPLYTYKAASAQFPEARPEPTPPPPEALPFPAGRLAPGQAEVLLAGDPMALRFLAVKQVAARGLAPVEECAARKDTNLGALLPLTAPIPPAAGLDQPLPPVSDVLDRMDGLYRGGRGDNAERAFLLDALLPKEPAGRQPYSPQDIASARKLQDRLGRLEDAGLITPEQRASESEAVEKLIASGTLPEVLQPPPPPAKPKPKAKKTGRGSRMEGGVSGRLEVIPSPNEPPKLTANAKGPAGMHLLSMGNPEFGDRAWEALQKEQPELAGLGHTVARADLGELGVTYRLVAGPLEPAQAQSLCATLKARGQTCTPTPFPAAGK